MKNFTVNQPTRVYFGKNQIEKLERELAPYKHILLAYGSGSIKKNGVYDAVVSILNKLNKPFSELSGIQPNPRISSVREGIRICKENKVDLILAVGAGSTIDCSKAIAFGNFYEGDPWDFFIGKARISKSTDMGVILTLPATGSETNGFTVVSNDETKEKLATGGDLLRPKFAILDPEYTMSLPAIQTAAGAADIMSHCFEQYFSPVTTCTISDRLAEAVMRTVVQHAPVALREPDNYDSRANIMWAGTVALNGILTFGKIPDWATHGIEHEISAIYDLAHGVGLAILFPNWMRYVLNEDNAPKFAEYAENVWGVAKEKPMMEKAKEGIDRTRQFFTSLGLPATLPEVGIDGKHIKEMAVKAVKNYGAAKMGSFAELSVEDVEEILSMSL
ncbi:MAG: iron-containing alcohol dehydrogenase [Bacteroidota bacterium]